MAPASGREWHWPPPDPTSVRALNGSERSSIDTCQTHHGVASRLAAALDEAGYTDRKWYLVHTDANLAGFVVTTRLEQIDSTGVARPGAERWSSKFPSSDGLSFFRYVKELIIPVSGHYRMLLFAVTSLPTTSAGASPALTQVEDWLKQGSADIPTELRAFNYSPSEGVAMYVYEFSSRSADEPAVFVDTSESTLTASAHFNTSGLASALTQGTATCPE